MSSLSNAVLLLSMCRESFWTAAYHIPRDYGLPAGESMVWAACWMFSGFQRPEL